MLFKPPIHVKTFLFMSTSVADSVLDWWCKKFASELLLQEVHFEAILCNVCHYVNAFFCKKIVSDC
jgi:hypothetical protein